MHEMVIIEGTAISSIMHFHERLDEGERLPGSLRFFSAALDAMYKQSITTYLSC